MTHRPCYFLVLFHIRIMRLVSSLALALFIFCTDAVIAATESDETAIVEDLSKLREFMSPEEAKFASMCGDTMKSEYVFVSITSKTLV